MSHDSHANQEEQFHEPTSYQSYILWGIALFVITALSLLGVTFGFLENMGGREGLNGILGYQMIWAVLKASILILIFMHLGSEGRLLKLFWGLMMFVFVVIFVLTSTDILFRY